jgi:signal transduction histidine kinase
MTAGHAMPKAANVLAAWLSCQGRTEHADPAFVALGIRLVSLARLTLATSVLLVHLHFRDAIVEQTTATSVFVFFLVYCAAVHGIALYRAALIDSRWWHWIDVAWGLAVVAASGGGMSDFYILLIFPALLASFRWGCGEAIAVSLVATAAWLLLGLMDGSAAGQGLHVAQRAVLLLSVGYMVAFWGAIESLQKKRLVLFGDLNAMPNPRAGEQQLPATLLERLREFYGADNCLAAVATDDSPAQVYMAREPAGEAGRADQPGELLLCLPAHCAVIHNATGWWSRLLGPNVHIEGTQSAEQLALAHTSLEGLAKLLDAGSWISVPLESRGAAIGRLYLTARHRTFGDADIGLLRQAMDKVVPFLEAFKLFDEMALEAADRERKRISLDLHDSAIQPYLGLKLGLESLRRKMGGDNPLAKEVDDLCCMTKDCIAELRGYVGVLNHQLEKSAASLREGLRMQVERFRGFYGIEVEVNYLSEMNLNETLTTEVLHMISESLSNIGRHTTSRRVTINLSSRDELLVTQIINQGGGSETMWRSFTPVSLSQRAERLGGHVRVARQPNGGTAVMVTIPL